MRSAGRQLWQGNVFPLFCLLLFGSSGFCRAFSFFRGLLGLGNCRCSGCFGAGALRCIRERISCRAGNICPQKKCPLFPQRKNTAMFPQKDKLKHDEKAPHLYCGAFLRFFATLFYRSAIFFAHQAISRINSSSNSCPWASAMASLFMHRPNSHASSPESTCPSACLLS